MTQLRLDGVVAGAASGNRGVSVTLNVLEVEVSTVVGTARQRIVGRKGLPGSSGRGSAIPWRRTSRQQAPSWPSPGSLPAGGHDLW